MTRFLIASSGHKDYLSPSEACESIANGFLTICEERQIEVAPMADGGDGTIDAVVSARRGKIIPIEVHDGLFRLRTGKMGIVHSPQKTAVIEIAEAAGSAILKPHERQTMIATSYGVGEMILQASDLGCSRMLVGLGGSIVSDAGIGMAQALGVAFFDNNRKKLEPICNPGFNALSLMSIKSYSLDELKIDLNKVEILVVSDVDICLLGENGQARTFGSQKGANLIEIEYLDSAFRKLAHVIQKCSHIDVDVPLAGAAGGLGAGLMGFLGAKLCLGAQIISDEIGLQDKIDRADVVVIGEGCMDQTTLSNKAPFFTARAAKNKDKYVTGIVGINRNCDVSAFCDELVSCWDQKEAIDSLSARAIKARLAKIAALAAKNAQDVLNN